MVPAGSVDAQPSALTERTASCSCGELKAVCQGEPPRVSVCHCGACKKRTGSAFAWNATYSAEQVTVSGERRAWARSSEDGRWCRQHFCPRCGATVFYEIEARPGMVTIPAGAFADPSFVEPSVSVYGELRCPWVRIEIEGTLTEI